MSVKIGDTVRYLNAVGGGVVTRFQGKDVVLLMAEDGFETPVLFREVVVVLKTNAYNFPTEDKTNLQPLVYTQHEDQEVEEQELQLPQIGRAHV